MKVQIKPALVVEDYEGSVFYLSPSDALTITTLLALQPPRDCTWESGQATIKLANTYRGYLYVIDTLTVRDLWVHPKDAPDLMSACQNFISETP